MIKSQSSDSRINLRWLLFLLLHPRERSLWSLRWRTARGLSVNHLSYSPLWTYWPDDSLDPKSFIYFYFYLQESAYTFMAFRIINMLDLIWKCRFKSNARWMNIRRIDHLLQIQHLSFFILYFCCFMCLFLWIASVSYLPVKWTEVRFLLLASGGVSDSHQHNLICFFYSANKIKIPCLFPLHWRNSHCLQLLRSKSRERVFQW